jgi:hypothetical protein
MTTTQGARALAKRILGRVPVREIPPAAANTYLEPGNQWYYPVLGGASTLAPRLGGGRMVREALVVLDRLDDDAYRTYVRPQQVR